MTGADVPDAGMRLFVGVFPPPEAVADLSTAVARLRVGRAAAAGTNVRLADPVRSHLTVAFLGQVDASRLVDVENALGPAAETFRTRDLPAADRPVADLPATGRAVAELPVTDRPAADRLVGGRTGSAVLRLGGGGSFGRGRFTVLWVDVRGDVEALRVLARLVRAGLRRGRLPYDEKPFTPHLTIARPGDRVDRADVAADREALHDYLGPPWPATELVLVRSHQGPKPTYDRVAAWPI
ncbi:2'-5' RNA ligase family protein [Micromonospora carbonacea]|uniref:2'-5' RNA ligase family protein n=1 Tax=Micromonospora carbonacea TaxID=47853 RepID=UPI00371A5361